MISAFNNTQPSFTSVVPLRVFIDGLETFDEKLIKSASRQLTSTLAGPIKTNQKLSIAREYAKFDPDYKLDLGVKGYPKKPKQKVVHPSDYFRSLIYKTCSFFISGKQAEDLKDLGAAIGIEQQVCKLRKIPDSYDLQVAKINYKHAIKNFLSTKNLRLRETFNPDTKLKSGDTVTLNLNMKSNGKHGLSTFKMKLDSIYFGKP